MAHKKFEPMPREKYLMIFNGKSRQIIASWRFYSILEVLRELGVSRIDALDAAKWAIRADAGLSRDIDNRIRLEVVEWVK